MGKTSVLANSTEAFAFRTGGIVAERLNHHPEWLNLYNRVRIVLTTHDAGNTVPSSIGQWQQSSTLSPDRQMTVCPGVLGSGVECFEERLQQIGLADHRDVIGESVGIFLAVP